MRIAKKNDVFWRLQMIIVVFLSCLSFVGYSQSFHDLSEMLSHYAGKKFHKLRQCEIDKIYDLACEDWHQICIKSLKKPEKSLPPIEVESDGVTYRLFGYTHGTTQLQAGAYERFIKSAFQAELNLLNKKVKNNGFPLDAIFTEENLTCNLLSSKTVLKHGVVLEIADHLLKKESELKNAAFKALRPRKRSESLRPVLSSMTSRIAMNGLIYAVIPNHWLTDHEYEEAKKMETKEVWSIPTVFSGDFDDVALQMTNEAQLLESQILDVQLGLSYELPSHLQMEYELKHWEKQQSAASYDGEVVSTDIDFERSLFMAGVLKGYAQYHRMKKISFFMGGWHLKHVYQILLDDEAVKKSWPYQLGLDLFESSKIKKAAKKNSIQKRKRTFSELEEKKPRL